MQSCQLQDVLNGKRLPKLAGTLSFALILTLVVAVLGNTSVPDQFLLANDIAVGFY